MYCTVIPLLRKMKIITCTNAKTYASVGWATNSKWTDHVNKLSLIKVYFKMYKDTYWEPGPTLIFLYFCKILFILGTVNQTLFLTLDIDIHVVKIITRYILGYRQSEWCNNKIIWIMWKQNQRRHGVHELKLLSKTLARARTDESIVTSFLHVLNHGDLPNFFTRVLPSVKCGTMLQNSSGFGGKRVTTLLVCFHSKYVLYIASFLSSKSK